jgi:hypothetical protein
MEIFVGSNLTACTTTGVARSDLVELICRYRARFRGYFSVFFFRAPRAYQGNDEERAKASFSTTSFVFVKGLILPRMLLSRLAKISFAGPYIR